MSNKPLMPSSRTIPALLAEQATRFGGREAFVAGEHRLTYAGLQGEVLRTARGLAALGVKRGDHVAILMGNRIEWVLAFFALQQLGATTVGLNTWATPREMEYALAHAEVTCLVAVDQFRRNDYRAMIEAMQPRASVLPKLRHLVWVAADPSRPATQAWRLGSTSRVGMAAVAGPPVTTVASGRCTSAPALVETAIAGSRGWPRSRSSAPAAAAASPRRAPPPGRPSPAAAARRWC